MSKSFNKNEDSTAPNYGSYYCFNEIPVVQRPALNYIILCAEMSNRSTRTKIRLLLTMALIIHWEPCCPELSHPFRDVEVFNKNEDSTAPKDGSRYLLRALSWTISSLLRDVESFNKNGDSTAPEDGSRYSLRALSWTISSPLQRCQIIQQGRRFDCS